MTFTLVALVNVHCIRFDIRQRPHRVMFTCPVAGKMTAACFAWRIGRRVRLIRNQHGYACVEDSIGGKPEGEAS
jgi:hypothetical protein